MSVNERDREDSYGYRGVKHRDNRHSHDGPEVTGPAPGKKKNKKLCKKNKWGPHHPGDWVVESHGWRRIKSCIYCGKHLEYQWKALDGGNWE